MSIILWHPGPKAKKRNDLSTLLAISLPLARIYRIWRYVRKFLGYPQYFAVHFNHLAMGIENIPG